MDPGRRGRRALAIGRPSGIKPAAAALLLREGAAVTIAAHDAARLEVRLGDCAPTRGVQPPEL